MEDFILNDSNRFLISNYQQKKPFTNLLPGIAGPLGIPMWIFYVNRGQCITSFGIKDKDHPIMEFQPANKAYQITPWLGFRTFIKVIKDDKSSIYEPFNGTLQSNEQKLTISLNELELFERSSSQKMEVDVLYYNLPGERIAGLIRQVKITNLDDRIANIEVVDGIPVIIPYGVSNQSLKENSRTIEAWMEIVNLENDLPFFHLRSSLGDTAEVKTVQAGNFAHAFAVQGGDHKTLKAIVDPVKVFKNDSSLRFPVNFQEKEIADLVEPSYTDGKTPCAFFGTKCSLLPHESITIFGIYGNANRLDILNQYADRLNSDIYLNEKRREANTLIEELTSPIHTKTSSREFDAYCKQTYLDNVLRGGSPVYFGKKDKLIPYHIYFRKHGDPERDYNAFYLAPEFYSQGNGNYRDINQNRRNEVWFHPKVNDANVLAFMSLIQSDGYNPLVVKGVRFWISPHNRKKVLDLVIQPGRLETFLHQAFTPGGLLKELEEKEIETTIPPLDFLHQVVLVADQYFDAEYGEGYWTDHWTYNLDMIESYLAIFPDRVHELFHEKKDIPFFESSIIVLPRSMKYVLDEGQPRQYKALSRDKEKANIIARRREYPNLMRIQKGRGKVYRTSLFAKLSLLAIIKFATLDPLGMGIEMEAGRPGWCDALNGLPGLFGSSMTETYALARLLKFLIKQCPAQGSILLPVELLDLIQEVVSSLEKYENADKVGQDYYFWDSLSEAREIYREKTKIGFDGEEKPLPFEELAQIFKSMQGKVNSGIDKAIHLNNGITPTYFTHEVDRYEILKDENGDSLKDEKGHPLIRAMSFKTNTLPLFLEGFVRMLNTINDTDAATKLYKQIRNSPLYDPILKMYRTNASLRDQPLEIGRLRVFTPGWLENESIFVHMEYKYLLEILRAGLYEEFFEDFRNTLIAFQDPARYGRSPLENSSFIVSSAHPDIDLHGTGFVARLTGATAEFLSIWTLMMIGKEPFFLHENELKLRLQPILPGWLFDERGTVTFRFLGQCTITYFNLKRRDTYSPEMRISKIVLYSQDDVIDIIGNVIPSPYAGLIREGEISKIDAFFIE